MGVFQLGAKLVVAGSAGLHPTFGGGTYPATMSTTTGQYFLFSSLSFFNPSGGLKYLTLLKVNLQLTQQIPIVIGLFINGGGPLFLEAPSPSGAFTFAKKGLIQLGSGGFQTIEWKILRNSANGTLSIVNTPGPIDFRLYDDSQVAFQSSVWWQIESATNLNFSVNG